ncbi:MAG: hypothetical protein P1U36_03065 [Legionellaceae bacterium]|nr:hypothetical protein [Legionellaceae bacterium]
MLHEFINPCYGRHYYTGGTFGFVVRDLEGYALTRISGLKHVLEFKNLDIPVLSTPEAFQAFVDNTPPMTRAAAMVIFDSVLTHDETVRHICAVVYEKKAGEDCLYLYDSSPSGAPDFELIKRYFRENFKLRYPNIDRQKRGICALYALQDIETLINMMGPFPHAITDEDEQLSVSNYLYSFFISPTAMETFRLPTTFSYDEDTLLKNYFHLIIKRHEAEPIQLDEPIMPPESALIA